MGVSGGTYTSGVRAPLSIFVVLLTIFALGGGGGGGSFPLWLDPSIYIYIRTNFNGRTQQSICSFPPVVTLKSFVPDSPHNLMLTLPQCLFKVLCFVKDSSEFPKG